jgi:hypothetical protein
MPRTKIHACAVLTIVLAAASAQTGNEAVVISPTFAVEGRVVKGVPYSAQAVTSVKQTLPTGSEISTQVTALVARDSEGRTRREQNITSIGPWAIAREPLSGRAAEEAGRLSPTVIVIQDPVKMVIYTLDPRTHLARMMRQRSPQESEAARNLENSRRVEEPRTGWARLEPGQEKVESLGIQTVEGIKAEGKRAVTIRPAGSIGNSAPLEFVVETWYSPELQLVVRGMRRDPRVGDMTYRLINIKRAEPPASFFEVPAEYRVETEQERRQINERERRKED